ncbi:LCP family protein [Catellatospora sp. NPDC049609]|uniref:LCP family protein n=1 Tax=Catellatospora sp. NPDC049609 TaxID=3155505 RepID=UPI00344998E2
MAKRSTLDRSEQQGAVPRQRSRRADGTGTRKKKRRRGAPVWATLLLTFGALLMMVSGGALIAMRSVIGDLEGSIQVAEPGILEEDPAATAAPAGGAALDGAFNILLLGIDTRTNQDPNNARSDTIMIMHVSAAHDQAYLMSLPRDLLVEIPEFKKSKYSGNREDLINAAFYHGAQNGAGRSGGLELAAKTITKLTKIQFKAAAVIDFAGFRTIIDALGTVNICVDGDADSLHHYYVDGKVTYVNEDEAKRRNLKPYKHKKGCREMPGWEALDYSRIRYSLTDGDYGRQRHQQQLIKAMAKKAGSAGVLTDFGKVQQLIDAVGKSLLISKPSGMSVTDFLFALKDVASADLVLLKTNAGSFESVYNGSDYLGERLNKTSEDMFRAAQQDKLGNFVLLNPQVVNKEK